MSHPFEQLFALTRANGQLILALAEIARTEVQASIELSSKASSLLADQGKDLKPGTIPAFKSEAFVTLLGDLAKERDKSLSRMSAAVDEWQGQCKDIASQAVALPELPEGARSWMMPWLANAPAKTGSEEVKASTPAKTSAGA